jgi:hypothetical protein
VSDHESSFAGEGKLDGGVFFERSLHFSDERVIRALRKSRFFFHQSNDSQILNKREISEKKKKREKQFNTDSIVWRIERLSGKARKVQEIPSIRYSSCSTFTISIRNFCWIFSFA